MTQLETKLEGLDFRQGIEPAAIPEGTMLLGHVRDEAVLLIRRRGEVFAIGAFCTHYGAPLRDGLLVGDTVRCPWHHACFDLVSGEALRAPALNPTSSWRVEQRGGLVYVKEKLTTQCQRIGRRPDCRLGHYRRGWCGGQCGCGNAPSRGLFRTSRC